MVPHFLFSIREYHFHQINPTSILQKTTFSLLHQSPLQQISQKPSYFPTQHSNMRLKTQVPFKIKSSNPCRSLLRVFKFKKPFFIRAFRCPKHHSEPKISPLRKLANKLRSLLKSLKKPKEMDRLVALKSFSESGYQIAPFPSPLTPAYARMCAAYDPKEEVDESCKSFEKYLFEMIVEQGKVEHSVDVEEFLHSWNNLKCPVFVDLVCRFYGELWKDLFGNSDMYMGTPLMRST